MITTFIIPSIGRETLPRAIESAHDQAAYRVGMDHDRIGPGEIRNQIIRESETPWVSMLDDDDTVTSDYVQRLEEEIAKHPEADLIIFREYFVETGELMPYWNEVAWGNVGVSFSIKRELALKYPFRSEPYEDYEFIKRIQNKGYNIFFSKYITYRARH